MITLFRNFARSKWAVALLALVAIALLFTGGQQMDVIGALQPAKVISAGSRSVGDADFRLVIEQARFAQQQQTGQSPAVEDLANEPGFAATLDARAKQLGFMAWAERVGIRPGRELVLREIRKVERFFDPVTRQFSETEYQSALAENKMTPQMLEEQLRDQYTLVHYATAMEAGAKLPRIYGAVIANQTQQTRDGRWFTVTQAMAGSAGAPTDQQLTAFMSQNAAQLRRPELRKASVIAFDNPADMQVEISEEKIQERFNFRRDSLVAPEKRTFVTLTAPDQATAARIAAALRAGQAPAAVASANNVQPANYPDTPRAAIGDPAVAAAVFGLGANQVSDPVRASVGFVVAKVASITPGGTATLESVRPQIVQELRESEAKAKIFARVEAYDAARRAGKPVNVALQEVGARVIDLPPITREGTAGQGQQLNLPPAMLQNIWRLPRGGAVHERLQEGLADLALHP
ncbi:MAG: peptidyl-prolyl cis-trans isomerase, partial [Brevundimonas sp.]